jgi:hypothetical protein
VTLGQLRQHCRTWQARLGLRDWTITVGWLTPEQAQAQSAQGTAEWNADEQTGHVSIDPESPDALATLIHELLHIRLDGHRVYPGYDLHQERAINAITAALMRKVNQ